MIKLTDRLNMIAGEIKQGETMADIGTDHGFLPIYLWENSISPYVIMTDVNEGPLKIAAENGKRSHPGFKFDLRLGNGLAVLQPEEVYAVVIAGMGGILISEIMAEDLPKSKTYLKFVLQPRNKRGYLRHFLLNNGFYIKKEKLVREGRYICNIITAVPKEDVEIPQELACEDPGSIKWEIPHNINKKNALYEELLVGMYEKETEIYQKMKRGEAVSGQELQRQKDRISYMKSVLDKERYFYDDIYE